MGDPGVNNVKDGPDRLDLAWLPLIRLGEISALEAKKLVLEALG